MSKIEVCLGALARLLSDLDLALERLDDERTEDALDSVVAHADSLAETISVLLDAFEEHRPQFQRSTTSMLDDSAASQDE